MKTFLIECLIPQGMFFHFKSNECDGKKDAKAAYEHFKEIGAKQIRVYEKKDVTENFK